MSAVEITGVNWQFHPPLRAGETAEDRFSEMERRMEAPRTNKWQPIETAPKDGTEVLVTKPGYTMAVAGFDYGEWRDAGDMGWGGYCDVEPTHWMPLPNPPSEHPAQEPPQRGRRTQSS